MSMRYLLLALAVAGASWHIYQLTDGSAIGGTGVAGLDGSYVRSIDFLDVAREGTQLTDLAVEGRHTIVEVYSDNCGTCERLEAAFPAFLKSRNDLVITRLRVPEGRLSQEQFRLLRAKMNEYDVCGTPHVLVIGPDDGVIAADGCHNRSKQGQQFLEAWIARYKQERT